VKKKSNTESKTLSAGYSATPLVQKLGIKPGFKVAFVNAPENFASNLNLPEDVVLSSTPRSHLDFAILFVKSETQLQQKFPHLSTKLKPNGMLWVAWPKKSSGVVSDLTFNNVQAIGLAAGLVDTKICAIDDVWSGLKFVFRLRDRARLT
jgi:hypothetical protein